MYKTSESSKSQSNITLRDYLSKYSKIKKMRSTSSINSNKTDLSPEFIFKSKISEIKILIKEKIKEQKVANLFEKKMNDLLEFYLSSAKNMSNLPQVKQEEHEGQKNKHQIIEPKNQLTPLPRIHRRISLKTDLTQSNQKNLFQSHAPSKFFHEEHQNSTINVELESSQEIKSELKENLHQNVKGKNGKIGYRNENFDDIEEQGEWEDYTLYLKKKRTSQLNMTQRISEKPPKLDKNAFY